MANCLCACVCVCVRSFLVALVEAHPLANHRFLHLLLTFPLSLSLSLAEFSDVHMGPSSLGLNVYMCLEKIPS